MQNCLPWVLAHCWLSKSVLQTDKYLKCLDPTTNLLHVQVARMLAFVLWDSIGKKFGRLPSFLHILKQYFRLTRIYKSRHKMRGGSLWIWASQRTSIWNCNLSLHFAFCKLHFSKFAGGKNRLFQTHSQSRFALVICRFANLNSACNYNTECTNATRDDRNQGNFLWRLYWIAYWTSVLAKRQHHACNFL